MLALLLLHICYAADSFPTSVAGDALARSLLNVTHGLGGSPGGPTTGTGVPFMQNAQRICDVKTMQGRPSRLHLLQGSMAEAKLLENHAYIVNIGFKQGTGELAGMSKVFFDNFNAQVPGNKISGDFQKMEPFQKAMLQAKTGSAKPTAHLGEAAGTGDLGSHRYVIFTGGTEADKNVVKSGTDYFSYIHALYTRALSEVMDPSKEVEAVVLAPLGIGAQFQPDYAVDRDVLVFYAGNMLTHWLAEVGAEVTVKDVYMVGYTANEVFSMCKYCQYRTLTPTPNLETPGLCEKAWAEAILGDAAAGTALFVSLVAMLW